MLSASSMDNTYDFLMGLPRPIVVDQKVVLSPPTFTW
jgi:hypothetical protein